jgi:hypothetical protein
MAILITEPQKPVTKSLFIVLIAAVVGALVFDALIVLANIFYDMRHHAGPWTETFGWVIMIPTLMVSNFTKEIPNAYLVNAVLGAFIFSVIAGFWQFFIKPLKGSRHENE